MSTLENGGDIRPRWEQANGKPTRVQLPIVDDQPINIRVLHQIFAEEHDVFMASSGE